MPVLVFFFILFFMCFFFFFFTIYQTIGTEMTALNFVVLVTMTIKNSIQLSTFTQVLYVGKVTYLYSTGVFPLFSSSLTGVSFTVT